MNQYGIQFEVKNKPSLDPEFMPILKFNRAFLETAKKPVSIALERSGGQVAVCDTFIHGTPEMRQADQYYIDRLVKSMLWMKGGFKVYVSGDEDIYNYLKKTFAPGGARSFDSDFMAGVYERPSEVVFCDKVPCRPPSGGLPGGLRRRRQRPQGVRCHRRRARLLRGSGLVPQDH